MTEGEPDDATKADLEKSERRVLLTLAAFVAGIIVGVAATASLID